MSEIIKVEKYDDKVIFKIASYIKDNKIVIMPSDTIYGFLALPEREDTLRIIKKRDNKPFLYLISNYDQLERLNIDVYKFKSILDKYWPGPFTFILDDKKNGVGVRMPDSRVLSSIIKTLNAPLISTSVNFSGEVSLNDINMIIHLFKNNTDLIINEPGFKPSIASTIVDLREKPFKIIRKGSYEFND